AAAKRTIRTLNAQVIVFVHLLLKPAFAADRQDVVLHANVQVLRFDARQIGLDDEFVLVLMDIDRRRPGREIRLLAGGALKSVVEQAIDLVLQSGLATKSCKCIHWCWFLSVITDYDVII